MQQVPAAAAKPQCSWHDKPPQAVFDALDTTPDGLTESEAQRRIGAVGPNRLPDPPGRSAWWRFLQQFHNILIYVLLGCAAITAVLGHVVDTLVILAVVVANAVIGHVQEGRAERAMAAIRQLLAPRASVLRGGARRSVDGAMLVPGDIVLLEAGDKVPADLRLLQARGLRVEEALLTGESLPVDKHTRPVAARAALGDRSCLAFSGTLVVAGQATGVVVATGAATEIGRISGLLAGVETLTTPLVAQMGVFARWLSFLILLVAVLLLLYGYFVGGYGFAEIFMAVVGLAVAAIPEGLPAVLTITLAAGVQAMARRNAIVRRLPAIETLGSVSVICTDKTGTLTRNEMVVDSVATSARLFTVDGEGYEGRGAIRREGVEVDGNDRGILRELAHAAILCSDARLRGHDGGWSVEGDPMEGALLAFAAKAGVDDRRARTAWTRTDVIPFDARHRFMATLNHDHEGHASVFVKGAPESIVEMCAGQRAPQGGTEPLDARYWNERAGAMAGSGQRVLAFAVGPVSSLRLALDHADIHGTLVLLGLAGLTDPPRAEAIDAVGQCHRAGIRVKMITGDHAGTAAAIAGQIGLRNPAAVLTGAAIDRMDDAGLSAAVTGTDVFARTSPEHKLRLVMALQSHGMTVAMTGDGVNDAPALKRADAGIAMGRNGSEVAKEAAELVLADDNFASIAAAVREGRTVYDNIKKVISWTLPTNAGEAATIIVALLFGMTLPVTPVQILWVNLVTAVTLGLALAFEPTEANTMQRPPRRRNEPLLNGELVWHIVLVSTLFLGGVFGMFAYVLERGHSIGLARTIALNTLVVMEIFHLFFVRNLHGTSLTWSAARGTPAVWMAVGAVTLAQLAITYLPPLQRVFATEPVSPADGFMIVGVGVALFAVLETEKQLRLRAQAMRKA